MSINRNLATFAKDVQTDGSLKGIAVTVTVAGGKFVIDGTSQQDMFLPKGVKYRFDVSDSTNANHPLRFSTTSDGTHGSGSAYTTGVTTSGTAGSSGAYVEVQLQQDAPDQLYYYCGNHSGMGAGAETAPVSSYGNSDVDTHLNTSGASSGQLLGWNGSDYAWVADSDTSGIDNLSEDTTPQLGGSLDVNGQSIVSASNGNIAITPNGSGKVVIDGLSHPTADGSANQVLKTDGSGNLSFVDQSSGGGGGSLTATASGALSNGQLIVVNSDGTVSPVYQTNSAATGSLTTYESATATYTRAAYDANAGKVVIAYRDD